MIFEIELTLDHAKIVRIGGKQIEEFLRRADRGTRQPVSRAR
jgi:hypothetical protein